MRKLNPQDFGVFFCFSTPLKNNVHIVLSSHKESLNTVDFSFKNLRVRFWYNSATGSLSFTEWPKSIIVSVLQGNQPPIQSPGDIVDLMCGNEAPFPHFRNSNTYKLFEPPVFENKIIKRIILLCRSLNKYLYFCK